jgi:hypothetical protein
MPADERLFVCGRLSRSEAKLSMQVCTLGKRWGLMHSLSCLYFMAVRTASRKKSELKKRKDQKSQKESSQSD